MSNLVFIEGRFKPGFVLSLATTRDSPRRTSNARPFLRKILRAEW